jgi:hypothetical protein
LEPSAAAAAGYLPCGHRLARAGWDYVPCWTSERPGFRNRAAKRYASLYGRPRNVWLTEILRAAYEAAKRNGLDDGEASADAVEAVAAASDEECFIDMVSLTVRRSADRDE